MVYDHNGMRIQKTLQHDWYPETTKYTYHGKLLTHMTVDYYDWDEVAQQDKLHFFYDAQSRPAKVSFNGVIYTYIHNLQGDIVGLLDSAGTLVVEYKYDAWGRLLSTTGSLADTLGKRNPFRYRGYVYDEETELYYLRSRYYCPEWGRFVNVDIILGQAAGICSYNSYAYCSNNPVYKADAEGNTAVSVPQTGTPLDALILLGALIFSWLTSPSIPAPPQTQSKPQATVKPTSTTSASPSPSITPAPQATQAPKLTPNPDEKYQLAVAFDGSAPITFGSTMDAIDVSILLHVSNWVGVYDELLKKASIAGVPVAYGVYTPLEADAATIASYFGASTRCDAAKGLKYPHYHGVMSDYEDLHFWYSPLGG